MERPGHESCLQDGKQGPSPLPGDDVLYNMMRRPLFSGKEIQEREELIAFFQTHEKEREQMQLYLSRIGKSRLGSLSDTVLALEDSPRVKTTLHKIMLSLILLDLAVLLPVNPVVGFFAFLVLMVANITIYYAGKDRKLIEAYLDCFTHLSADAFCCQGDENSGLAGDEKADAGDPGGKEGLFRSWMESLFPYQQEHGWRRSFPDRNGIYANADPCGHFGL